MGSTGFDVGALFANPNFQQLLAGVGQALDPNGFGGRLGAVANRLTQNKAAQGAVGTQEEQRQQANSALGNLLLAQSTPPEEGQAHFINAAIQGLGGYTPAGTPGVTGVKLNPKGSINIEVDPPGAAPAQEQTQNSTPVSAEADAPAPSQLAAVSSNNTLTTPTTTEPPKKSQLDISSVIPFY